MRIRPLDPYRDGAEVRVFLRRMQDRGRAGLSESKYRYLAGSGETAGLGLLAEDEGILGYAALAPAATEGEWGLEVVAEPEAIPSLVEAAIELVGTRGAQRVRWWTYEAALETTPPRYGFEPERLLLRMECTLPASAPEFPSGYEVGSFRPGQDEGELLRVNNAAFVGHPENSNLTMAELEARFALDWFDAQGIRMAWKGAELAGFCWTKKHSSEVGEIYIIGVAPRHQGRGLGRALVLEGLRYLSAAGCEKGLLYTEGDNVAAVALYESLGFQTVERFRAFTKDLT